MKGNGNERQRYDRREDGRKRNGTRTRAGEDGGIFISDLAILATFSTRLYVVMGAEEMKERW